MKRRQDGVPEKVPRLVSHLSPPTIRGTAALTHRAYEGAGLGALIGEIGPCGESAAEQAAFALDLATVFQLSFRPRLAAALQHAALAHCRVFRVGTGFAPRSAAPLRVLALVVPGDLMTNTPLDFITAHLDVRLDLLFVLPGEGLPAEIPDHDVAFFAVSEAGPELLARLSALFAAWPRPALNDPARVMRLARDEMARGMSGMAGVCVPELVRLSRAELERSIETWPHWPAVIRPVGSHAGRDLCKIDAPSELAPYLAATPGEAFFLARFVDYRSADGLFRKSRLVFIGNRPMLCHQAVSEHWMVHYLNAGMSEHADRREDEAHAMAAFDHGFAMRHAQALASVARWIGLDYAQIDCAETRDGRLLIFEADVAAIVHLMDPPALFPYKQPQMRRVFAAFEALLRERVSRARQPA